jgi:hypothetical protein
LMIVLTFAYIFLVIAYDVAGTDFININIESYHCRYYCHYCHQYFFSSFLFSLYCAYFLYYKYTVRKVSKRFLL